MNKIVNEKIIERKITRPWQFHLCHVLITNEDLFRRIPSWKDFFSHLVILFFSPWKKSTTTTKLADYRLWWAEFQKGSKTWEMAFLRNRWRHFIYSSHIKFSSFPVSKIQRDCIWYLKIVKSFSIANLTWRSLFHSSWIIISRALHMIDLVAISSSAWQCHFLPNC